jgi:hypothetical protein
MKNNPIPTLTPVPKIGSEYIKLKTGELVKWESFDEKRQTLTVRLPNGELSEIHRRDVGIPTANEEVDYLLSKGKS